MNHLRSRHAIEAQEAALHRTFYGGSGEGVIETAKCLNAAIWKSDLPAGKKVMLATCVAVALAPVVWELDGMGVSVFETEEEMEGATVVGVPA
jgi:hypothetical protein